MTGDVGSTTALRAEAVVDLAAVRDNVAALGRRAAGAAVMAVVKADGYGHGMVPCARAAVAGGATWLGVATTDEALALRAAGLAVPVLCWLVSPAEDLTACVAGDIDVSVASFAALAQAERAGRAAGRTARVHLKADTGLGRNGATPRDWPDLVAAARAAETAGSVRVAGIWSHFAYADAPGHPTVRRQVAVFGEVLEAANRAGLRPEVRHLANSAATLTAPDTHLDLVRPGLAVYGLSPVPELGGPTEFGLRPAMTLRASVVLAKRVPPGHGVSYAHRYTTSRETTLALVPLGYADGVPRAATNGRALVRVGGRTRDISGTVCMDQFVVDVGDDPVAAGDDVVLFGPGDDGEATAEDWARVTGTISYEIVTRIGPRVPRTYLGAP